MSNQDKPVVPQISESKIIKSNAFHEVGVAHNNYHVTVGVEFKKEDLFLPENWIQIIASGARLNIGDHIEICREDFNFYMLGIVMSVNKHGLVLKELMFKQLEDEIEKEDEGLTIKWSKGRNYVVVRANGKELGSGFKTKAQAQNFLENQK